MPPTGDPRVLLPTSGYSRLLLPAPPCGYRGVNGAAALGAAVATLCGGYVDVLEREVVGKKQINFHSSVILGK